MIAAAFAACTRNTIDRPKAVVRDSAGIQIAENTEPSWTGEDGWRLSNRPLLDIGDIEGDPNYELYLGSGAVRLPNGRIVVANRWSAPTRRLKRRVEAEL